MRTQPFLFCGLMLFAQVGCVKIPESKKEADTPMTRIGTYDSRAIAVAFVGSEVYNDTVGETMAEMMEEYRKAESEGDKKRVEELRSWGKAQQALRHKQGFSTAPVDDILEHITDQLPAIKRQANVELLVSKWDTKTLARHKSAQHVDVTMLLVETLKPNEKQKKSAIEIQKHDPVPLQEMERREH